MDLTFIQILDRLDGQLLLWLNSMHTPILDVFMKTVTNKWLWMPLTLVLAVLTVRHGGWRRAVLFMLCTGLAVALSDQLCATYIRPAIERLRPSNPLNPLSAYVHLVNDYRGGRFGFPSCHASTSISMAIMLSLYFRKRGATIFFFSWVALMCYSRIYLGVHYPGDILAGFVVGGASAAVSYMLYRALCRVDLRALTAKLRCLLTRKAPPSPQAEP